MTDLAAGHASSSPTAPSTDDLRRLSNAAAFRADPGMENVLAMRTADPAGYRALPPSLKLSAGYYAQAKQDHADTPKDQR